MYFFPYDKCIKARHSFFGDKVPSKFLSEEVTSQELGKPMEIDKSLRKKIMNKNWFMHQVNFHAVDPVESRRVKYLIFLIFMSTK